MPDISSIVLSHFGDRIQVFDSQSAWVAARTPQTIGGSDVPAILGVSPWASPWDVWARKVEGIEPEYSLDTLAAFRRGHRFEPVVLAEYTEETGRETALPGGPCIIRHSSEPWAFGSPDAFALDGGVLGGVEAKTASRADGWGEEMDLLAWEDGSERIIPPVYALQVYWYLECSGLPWWDLVVLLPRYETRVYRLRADPAIQGALLERVAAWRKRHLIGGEPPPIDGSDAVRAWLTRTFPGDAGKRAVPASSEVQDLAARLGTVQLERKAAEAQERQIKAELQAAMGDTYKATCGAGSVVCTLPGERRTLDGKALKSAHPDIYDAFERVTPTTRSVRLYGGWSK